VSGSRGIFYDNTMSGDRLVREYLQTNPANWVQTFESPFHTYRYTSAGASNCCTLMSAILPSNLEVNAIMKGANVNPMMGIALRKSRNAVFIDAGMIYLWLTGGTLGLAIVTTAGATPVLATAAYVVDITKWHHLRIQVIGRLVNAKVWVHGTAEPAWMISYRVGYKEMKMNGTVALLGTTETVYYTDFRATPIPRTGGP